MAGAGWWLDGPPSGQPLFGEHLGDRIPMITERWRLLEPDAVLYGLILLFPSWRVRGRLGGIIMLLLRSLDTSVPF